MKFTITALGALALTTSMAQAGGIDRSGQGIGAIFEKGNYAELSFGKVSPAVDGVWTHPTFGPLASGNVAPSYSTLGIAVKTDINAQFSLGLIMDNPFGASVAYTRPPYPLNGTTAQVNSDSITLLARYRINDAFSVHGGLRQVTMSGFYDPTGSYASTYSKGSDLGYVIGAAFEKPEIAMRVALTYSNGTEYNLEGTAGDIVGEMPASVNLDFQSGVAADTLVFGSIRWADWTSAYITDTLAGNLVDYTEDTMTYSIGVGRKFSDSFSGALTLGYEKSQDTLASNLSPTDGYMSVGVGGTYTSGNMKISGGVRFVEVGDAVTEPFSPSPGASFADNSAMGLGVKVSFSF
jgi:long-chain fatty acid transport protein